MQPDHSFHTAIHMLVLIDRDGSGQLSSAKIADSIGTNPVVIRRMSVKLKEHGLIKVRNGKAGGYFLSRPAGSISLWEVYLAIRKENVFRSRPARQCDAVAETLPEALEDVFAKAEYSMKQSLSSVTIKHISAKIR